MNKPKSNPLDVLLASLYGRINYERQLKVTPRSFKLQNMREFLRRLGDPHLQCPVVHVAGTKGKGSVATMVGQILTCSGRRTGVYLSPHLEVINQRMMVDGGMITDQQLFDVLKVIQPIADQLDRERDADDHRKLTFFELTTAAAFYFFAQQNADAVVLEVGLGGRMDSTNVCQPMVSIITNISFDHTRQLGNTLAKIAWEKAGIIKPGVPVISGTLAPDAAQVIATVAAENNSSICVLGRDFAVGSENSNSVPDAIENSVAPVKNQTTNSSFFVSGSIDDEVFRVDQLSLNMMGPHQQTNAALAVTAAQLLNRAGWRISDEQIREGLAEARLAGRTELLRRCSAVMLDIAHNVASVNALITTLHTMPEWNLSPSKTLIVAVSREKDAVGMLQPLLPEFDRVIFTKYQNNPRGRDAHELFKIAQELAEAVPQSIDFQICEQPVVAWQTAQANRSSEDFICVAGSAFLIAELRPLVQATGFRD